MSDPIDISRLRDLAREATPGPWREWKDQILIGEEWVHDLPTYCDARYLAALSPDVLLALLDRLERAERERDEARAAWAGCAGRLVVMHRPGCAAVRRGRSECDCDALSAREALARLREALSGTPGERAEDCDL